MCVGGVWCACVRACACVCVCVRAVSVHACVCTHGRRIMYVRIHIYTCMYVHKYVCTVYAFSVVRLFVCLRDCV